MKRSIYAKNFFAMATIVLLSFLLLGGAFSAISYRFVINEQRESMTNAAQEALNYVGSQTRFATSNVSSLEVRMGISMISRASGYDIIVANTDGVIVSCSDKELICPHIGLKMDEAVLNNILSGREFSSGSFSAIYGSKRHAVGAAIITEDKWGRYTVGYLFVSVGSSQMSQPWRNFLSVFMLLSVSVLSITFIGSLLTTRRQVEPINEMARAARKFARGDYATRVEVTGREDEIGELAAAFNAMADSMERSEDRRRELIANVSHELKTPMTVISGFADGILDGTIPKEQEAKYLETISSETRRLSRLVRSLLDVAQVSAEADKMRAISNFDIAELIRVAIVGLIPKFEAKQLDVEPQLPEEPVLVTGEKDSITQVVYNLLDNAVKFATPGTALRIALWRQGEHAYVSIENEGEIISESDMPLIFDRFYKSDRSRGLDKEGVGLGLYLVKTILDRHNQSIYVTSKDGITKFTFTMKISQPEPKRAKNTTEETNKTDEMRNA